MKRRAWIYAAGNPRVDDIAFYKRLKHKGEDLVICADGGYDVAQLIGVTPDVIIGDMDSIVARIPKSIQTIVHPKKKDKTDLQLCVDYAIEQGCDEIILLGAFGGRIDHSLGAIIMLRYILEMGAEGMLLTKHSKVCLIKDRAELSRGYCTNISLIPLTDKVEGVTTTGLLYPLENATLHQVDNLGISNEFFGSAATIEIKSGLLYIICETE